MSRAQQFPVDAKAFLQALGARMGPDERLITCGFPGDPGDAVPANWRPRPWGPKSSGWGFPTGWNGYVTVGAFGRAEDGSWRRRAGCYMGGLALMVDDVGTKVSRAVVERLAPSAIVTTSPGNEQWWYFLEEPERDAARFDALIRAFIAGPLRGQDPGMASVTRVGRLPSFNNGKRAYGGKFETVLETLNEKRFTIEQLVEEFNLELIGRRASLPRIVPEDGETRIESHFAVRKFLAQANMLKRPDPNRAGWTEITCPWVQGHTGAVDNGAAIREPHEENGFHGAFMCHHGSCAGRGWRELTEWVAEEAAEMLEQIDGKATDELFNSGAEE